MKGRSQSGMIIGSCWYMFCKPGAKDFEGKVLLNVGIHQKDLLLNVKKWAGTVTSSVPFGTCPQCIYLQDEVRSCFAFRLSILR